MSIYMFTIKSNYDEPFDQAQGRRRTGRTSDEKEQGAGSPDAPVGRSGSPLYSDMEQGKQPRDFNMLTAKLLRAMDIGTYKS